MSQDYKLKFEQMRENKPGKEVDDNYANAGYVRNIGFLLTDGSSKFLNYAYLVSCAYHPTQGLIVLNFTSDIVTIKGSGLEPLYESLFNHVPRKVEVINTRYSVLSDQAICVTSITIDQKN